MKSNTTTTTPEHLTIIEWHDDFSVTHTNEACLPRPSPDGQLCKMDIYSGDRNKRKTLIHLQVRPNRPDMIKKRRLSPDNDLWRLPDLNFGAGIDIANRLWRGLNDAIGLGNYDAAGRQYKMNEKTIITVQTHCEKGAITLVQLQDHIHGHEVRLHDQTMIAKLGKAVSCENAND